MSCTAQDIIDDLRCRLNDTDSSCYVYESCALLNIIRQSTSYLVSIRPDLTATTMVVELEPGCYQKFCSTECNRVLDVRAENGDCFKPGAYDAGKIDYVDALFPDVCVSSEDFTPGKWKSDEHNPCAGWLSNEVPTGNIYKASVICVPPVGDIDETTALPDFICNEYYSVFIDIILSKVYLIDHEDGFDDARARTHYQMAQEAIDQKFLIDFAGQQPDWSIYRRKTNA